MKMNKKKVFALALAVCLIATLSMGSLAWFTDEDAVTNKFYIASSEDDTADEIFSVDVYEEYDSNGDGTDEEYQVGITYTDILPGDVLQKEAYVKNTGHYDQYVRVTVEISDAAAWKAALGTNFNDETLVGCFAGYEAENWRRETSEYDEANDVIRITMYYNGGNKENRGIVAPEQVITVFTGVNIPWALTREQAVAFNGGFEIAVKAEAVQTENLGVNTEDSICDAYEAFLKVETTTTTNP